jgi:hypothetical protein
LEGRPRTGECHQNSNDEQQKQIVLGVHLIVEEDSLESCFGLYAKLK